MESFRRSLGHAPAHRPTGAFGDALAARDAGEFGVGRAKAALATWPVDSRRVQLQEPPGTSDRAPLPRTAMR